MSNRFKQILHSQQAGLLLVIVALALTVAYFAGTVKIAGVERNRLLNASTLMDMATETSFFAIMAVGATMVIISGGIDLSVGSTYALAGLGTALALRAMEIEGASAVVTGLLLCVGIGLGCGLINGVLVVLTDLHPFIITLGTMWIFRGVANVLSTTTIFMPKACVAAAKSSLLLPETLHPVPLVTMLALTALGVVYLRYTVPGRHVFAVGGNVEAARYAGLRVKVTLLSVYVISGLTAGLAAYLGSSYYGSASCGDASGYELYVIASAVVGGVSLSGGRGSVFGALLGAVLIVLIRASILNLGFNAQYEWIIVGTAIILAAFLDRVKAKWTAEKLAREAQTVRSAGDDVADAPAKDSN